MHSAICNVIANNIKHCKTDSFPSLEFNNPDITESNNLLSIYHLMSGKTKVEVAKECQNMKWGTFKTLLTDGLIGHLDPIQACYKEIMSDSAYLNKVLADGAMKAADIAVSRCYPQ